MYKRLFLFLPPNISIFVCYPSLFGNGEMAHGEDSVRAPVPTGLTAGAVLFLRHIQLLSVLLPHWMFVSFVVCEGKIYLAHTLEWHT